MNFSVVVPCFNEEKSIPSFYDEINHVLKSNDLLSDYEIIFIDDGSRDNTLKVIKNLSLKDNKIKFISFSKNFGKESAMYAGLKFCNGDYIAIMDADLQDPPSLLPEMIQHLESGEYDCIGTYRVTRDGEPFLRSLFANMFYKIINKLSKIEILNGARDYRVMTRQMVDSILEVSEYNRFSKGIFAWVGYETKWIKYQNIGRENGESSWSFWELIKYSIEGIVSFSTAPLALSTISGIIFSILAFIAIIFIVIRTLLFGEPVVGWPSLICSILLVGGIQLISIGILGQYLSKTYLETKNRPIFITKETNIK